MKKFIFIAIIIALLVFAYTYKNNESKPEEPTTEQVANPQEQQEETAPSEEQKQEEQAQEEQQENVEEDVDKTEDIVDVRPAIDVYTSSEQALEAIKKAATTYDDAVIEQFHMLGNCEWCDELYSNVRNLMADKSLSADERGFFAELLSTTGKKENIEAVVKAVVDSSDPEDKDIYSEALELSNLSVESLNYLQDVYKNESDKDLKEATIAAISNQGTKESVEILYNITKENGDANGFYDIGVGLGEVVPEASAIPVLEDIAGKRDEYSHLAVKALLNSGNDGTQKVLDLLGNSQDANGDIKLFDLEKAIDHVLYDDKTKEIFATIQNPNEAQKYFMDGVVKASQDADNDDEE